MSAAGLRDRRISILRAAIVDDGLQRRSGEWTELTKRWARVIVARGREARAALGTDAEMPATFTILWSADVANVGAGDRIHWDGLDWDIKAAVEIGRRREIELHAVTAASLSDE